MCGSHIDDTSNDDSTLGIRVVYDIPPGETVSDGKFIYQKFRNR